ncbi:hypothetical protein [Roseovarius sp.]|uniref:hypothetical protein n=1 Tax=Roseovarius sp. TaxID=1486281 RepID=UPI003A98053F
MIGRILSIATALAFTTSAVTGIVGLIALDLAGKDRAFSAIAALTGKPAADMSLPKAVVAPAPTPLEAIVEAAPILEGAEDITFFTQVPVEGMPFDVQTGTRFATPSDLASGLMAESWCYITAKAPDGVTRKIELAAQEATSSPIYEALKDLPLKELSVFKMGAAALETLAKTHCRLGKTEASGEREE